MLMRAMLFLRMILTPVPVNTSFPSVLVLVESLPMDYLCRGPVAHGPAVAPVWLVYNSVTECP